MATERSCSRPSMSSLLGVGDDRVEDAGLGVELVVAGGTGDAGLGGDVIDARVMEATCYEQMPSRLDDLAADLGDILLGSADLSGPG